MNEPSFLVLLVLMMALVLGSLATMQLVPVFFVFGDAVIFSSARRTNGIDLDEVERNGTVDVGV